MKDALDLQKFYPEEISVTEVMQNEKEIYIHVSVQSKNCTCPYEEKSVNNNLL